MKRKSTYPPRPLPTDKHGNVYRGPRTYAEASEAADHIIEQSRDMNPGWREHQLSGLVRQIRAAGYTGVAAKLAKEYT